MREELFFDDTYFEDEYSQDDYIEDLIKSMEKKYSTTEQKIIISNHSNPFEDEPNNCFED